MKKQRVACLTEYEAQVLAKLYAYQSDVLLPNAEPGFCQPRQLGGLRQSHHARTLRRLVERGFCEQTPVREGEVKREVFAYRISDIGRVIWSIYCEHTGQSPNSGPNIRSLLDALR
jgi:hypothetical protein